MISMHNAAQEVLHSMPIELHGQILQVVVRQGQEPADAALIFCEENVLPQWFRDQIVKQLCAQPVLDCQRTVPLLLIKRVQSENGREIGMMQFLEGTEPAHIVELFCEDNSIAGWYCQAMLDEICSHKRLVCNELELVLFQTMIQNSEFQAELRITGHQVPEQAVTGFCQQHSIPATGPFCNQLMQAVCANNDMRCGQPVESSGASLPVAGVAVATGELILDSPINSEDGTMVNFVLPSIYHPATKLSP
jgi:hypothetical protein